MKKYWVSIYESGSRIVDVSVRADEMRIMHQQGGVVTIAFMQDGEVHQFFSVPTLRATYNVSYLGEK